MSKITDLLRAQAQTREDLARDDLDLHNPVHALWLYERQTRLDDNPSDRGGGATLACVPTDLMLCDTPTGRHRAMVAKICRWCMGDCPPASCGSKVCALRMVKPGWTDTGRRVVNAMSKTNTPTIPADSEG